MATADELRAAAGRITAQHFHEDEPSPLLEPEDDDDIRDDCLAVAHAYLALRAACERLVAAELVVQRADVSTAATVAAFLDARQERDAALREIAGLVGEG